MQQQPASTVLYNNSNNITSMIMSKTIAKGHKCVVPAT